MSDYVIVFEKVSEQKFFELFKKSIILYAKQISKIILGKDDFKYKRELIELAKEYGINYEESENKTSLKYLNCEVQLLGLGIDSNNSYYSSESVHLRSISIRMPNLGKISQEQMNEIKLASKILAGEDFEFITFLLPSEKNPLLRDKFSLKIFNKKIRPIVEWGKNKELKNEK